jgi:outer membrane protein assembly factor BamB
MKPKAFKAVAPIVALLFTALVAYAQQRGTGQSRAATLFENMCSGCHRTDVAASARYSREEWTDVVQRMVDKGAILSKAEIATLVEYLTGKYGRSEEPGTRAANNGAAAAYGSPVQPFVESPVAPFGQLAVPYSVPSAPVVGAVSTPLIHDGLLLANGAIAPRNAVSGTVPVTAASYSTAGEWRQWGGPRRDFKSDATGLADSWPEAGPRTIWDRPLGLGHSAIAFDGGMLFTLYRPGRTISRTGPWERRESVIALDAASGKTVWEFEYPSEPLNFSYGSGPHAMPLVLEKLVIAPGTNKQIHALDKKTGRLVWSHDLVKEYGAPPTLIRPAVKAGYGASPIAFKDMAIVVAGGRGQSVMAFRQNDGALVWKGGDFLTAEAAPILIDVDGRMQLVVVGGQTVNGIDPDTILFPDSQTGRSGQKG